MKKIKLFRLKYCPHCVRAMQYMQEYMDKNPACTSLEIEIIDEGEERKLATQYDYYYVPTFYLDSEKVHEGAVTRQQVEKILEQALETEPCS